MAGLNIAKAIRFLKEKKTLIFKSNIQVGFSPRHLEKIWFVVSKTGRKPVAIPRQDREPQVKFLLFLILKMRVCI